jgi:hypothetical protein
VQAAPPLAAEAVPRAQQTEPEPACGGSTKNDKEKLRKDPNASARWRRLERRCRERWRS